MKERRKVTKTRFMMAFMCALVLAGAANAQGGVSFRIGTNNFYLSVGDYDYLPYAYENDPGYSPPPINFNQMMSQYGRWENVSPFGQVWQPYASAGWRPYAYGHWIYTEYGPYWEGYEPWAWAGYHYGSWIVDRQYGWVWVPGSLAHAGANNQFSYSDNDFGARTPASQVIKTVVRRS